MYSNPFIDFLRTFGPASSSDSIWDEHVAATEKRMGVAPIKVHSPYVDKLVENFRSTSPANVILTGTAGDGKTWHCRQVFFELGGTSHGWAEHDAAVELRLPHANLVVIKDLSWFFDLPTVTNSPLEGLLPAILGITPSTVYLVAANDGQLLRFFRTLATANPLAETVDEKVRILLKDDLEQDASLNLRLYNLSRQSHAHLFDDVVNAVAFHPGWETCTSCPLFNDLCPIRHNLGALTAPTMRRRLGDLIRLAAHNDAHLPVRQLLLLAVNILVGVRDKQAALMDCARASSLVAEGDQSRTNPYDNALGLNLPNHAQRERYRSFTVLAGLGLGRETSGPLDSLLLETSGPQSFVNHTAIDEYHRGTLDDLERLREALEHRRRWYFFTEVQEGPAHARSPWQLTIFNHGWEYIRFAEELPSQTAARLVTGLNRIFTGTLCVDNTHVWLASPTANTESRLGRVLEARIRVGFSRSETTYFEFDRKGPHGQPRMAVRTAAKLLETHTLTPLLFEYLMRVWAGTLPRSFSTQCAQELRQFRLQVLAHLQHEDLLDRENLNELEVVRLGADARLVSDSIKVSR
jgi:hypothetical protein